MDHLGWSEFEGLGPAVIDATAELAATVLFFKFLQLPASLRLYLGFWWSPMLYFQLSMLSGRLPGL